MSTSASMGAPLSKSVSQSWLYSRGIDLCFGYGLGYLLCIPALLVAGAVFGPDPSLFWIGGIVSMAVITPHYGATALRVYEQRDERRKYAIFAFGATGVLLVLFGVGLTDRMLGSLLLTLYISWSPWHFSGQNYGLAVMYLRRNGVALPDEIKRPLYASFVSSAVLAISSVQISHSDRVFAQVSDYTGTFQVLKLGIPFGPGVGLAAVVAIFHCASLGLFWIRLRRSSTTVSLLPIALLVATQALWFTVPAASLAFGAPQLMSLLPFTAFVISAAHSAQYLWVTSYYARLAREHSKPTAFFLKAAMAGGVLGLPGLLFAPALLGLSVPNGSGALMLAFAVLNLHHFVLDGAIWKLRDGRIARALLRSQGEDSQSEPGSRRHWLRAAVLTLGLVALVVEGHAMALRYRVYHSTDSSQLTAVRDRLVLLGRDGADVWMALGASLDSGDEKQRALAAYSEVEKRQQPLEAWVANRLALLLLELHPRDPESLQRATQLAEYVAVSLGRTNSQGQQTLAHAYAAAGRDQEADAALREAAAIAREIGQRKRAEQLERQAESDGALAP